MARLLRDRYALDEVIGAGGAAKVYKAHDRALERVVAVKLLDDAIARSADPGGRDRFLREAKSAARIQHPNLVTVFDAGEDAGELFLVMEYVDGRTLADVIAERSPLSIDESVSIATQILGGLAAVHANGTIHRDIKPANVLLEAEGRVLLTDFGIAKRLDDIDAAVTTAGMLVGTPHYLAPEQATGQPLSSATDVYQVALVLHEMLTGERAGGSSPAMTAVAEPVDPRAARPDVPEHVADAVVQATQRDPARRFDSAQAMIAALTSDDGGAPVMAVAAMRGAAAGVGRTMTMPVNDATAMLPGAVSGAGGGAATVVAAPLMRATPPDPEALRRRRNWIVGSVALFGFALLGAWAIAYGGDADGGTLVPGTETTLPAATTVAPPPTTVPVVVPVVTAPPTAAPTAPVDEDDDKPGKGNGRDNKGDEEEAD